MYHLADFAEGSKKEKKSNRNRNLALAGTALVGLGGLGALALTRGKAGKKVASTVQEAGKTAKRLRVKGGKVTRKGKVFYRKSYDRKQLVRLRQNNATVNKAVKSLDNQLKNASAKGSIVKGLPNNQERVVEQVLSSRQGKGSSSKIIGLLPAVGQTSSPANLSVDNLLVGLNRSRSKVVSVGTPTRVAPTINRGKQNKLITARINNRSSIESNIDRKQVVGLNVPVGATSGEPKLIGLKVAKKQSTQTAKSLREGILVGQDIQQYALSKKHLDDVITELDSGVFKGKKSIPRINIVSETYYKTQPTTPLDIPMPDSVFKGASKTKMQGGSVTAIAMALDSTLGNNGVSASTIKGHWANDIVQAARSGIKSKHFNSLSDEDIFSHIMTQYIGSASPNIRDEVFKYLKNQPGGVNRFYGQLGKAQQSEWKAIKTHIDKNWQ